MKPKKSAPVSTRRSVDTFRAKHDPDVAVPNKIREALTQMAKDEGPEAYAYEVVDPDGQPFVKRAGISTQALSQYREQFTDHIVEVKQDTGSRRGSRFVWFATAAAAKKARKA